MDAFCALSQREDWGRMDAAKLPARETPFLKSERQYREEICRFGKMLHERGFVAATDGNLSVRLADGNILVTPTGMCKSMMEADDMAVVDLNGRQLSGRRGVTSEIGMHLLIYRLRPDINAV